MFASIIAWAAFCTRLTSTCWSACASIATGAVVVTSVDSRARALRSCGSSSAPTWRSTDGGLRRSPGQPAVAELALALARRARVLEQARR